MAYNDVPQPHNPTDLVLSAFGGIDAGIANYQNQNQPGDSALDAYINRVLAGEHPEKLAAEARANPAVAAELQRLLQQGGQQSDLRHLQNDVGMPGGQPAVLPPGTQPHAPFAQPPQQSLGAMGMPHGPAVGGHGGPAASPAPMYQSGAMMPPAQQPAPSSGPNMISAAGQLPPQLPSLGGYGQVAQQAMQPDGGMPQGQRSPLMPRQAEAGPPMQTAQLPPPQMQTAVSPRPMAMPAPQPAPQPRPQPAQPMSVANRANAPAQPPVRKMPQQMQIMNSPAFAGAAAGQSREWIATQNNQTKETIALSKQELDGQVAALKSMGLSDQQISKGMQIVMTQNAENQRATLKAFVDMANEQTRAGATMGAAKARGAKEGPSAILEDLKKLRAQVQAWRSVKDWATQGDLADKVSAADRQIAIYQDYLGLPREGGPEASPAPAKGGQAPTSGGKQPKQVHIRFRRAEGGHAAGTTGWVDAADFDGNDSLYERIP
jgi:hypothetical protein